MLCSLYFRLLLLDNLLHKSVDTVPQGRLPFHILNNVPATDPVSVNLNVNE
jgi:hypothetical protein